MRWYNQLYVGQKAKKKRRRIIETIRYGKFPTTAYVITPALSGNNILDIYPAAVLPMPWYSETDFYILGIADDYWEALEVARQIVDDMYQATGGFDLDTFLREKQ